MHFPHSQWEQRWLQLSCLRVLTSQSERSDEVYPENAQPWMDVCEMDSRRERKKSGRIRVNKEGWIIPDSTAAGILAFLPLNVLQTTASCRTYREFLHLFPSGLMDLNEVWRPIYGGQKHCLKKAHGCHVNIFKKSGIYLQNYVTEGNQTDICSFFGVVREKNVSVKSHLFQLRDTVSI